MKLGFDDNISRNDRTLEDVSKVLDELFWLYNVDLTAGLIVDWLNCFKITLVTFDRYHIDSHSFVLGISSHLLIELFSGPDLSIIFLFFKTPKSCVCQSICTQDNLRS